MESRKDVLGGNRRGAGFVRGLGAPRPWHARRRSGRSAPGFSCCFRAYVKCCSNEKALFSYTHERVYFLVPSGVERALSLKKIPLETDTSVVVVRAEGR